MNKGKLPRSRSAFARIGGALREDGLLFVASLSFAIAAFVVYEIVRALGIAH